MPDKTITYIGIDPGERTGIAIIQHGQYVYISTMDIIHAMDHIRAMQSTNIYEICLHVENPNMRKYYGPNPNSKLQGAGSIKRDYKIWTQFAHRYNIRLFPVPPAEIGSSFDSEVVFHAATGYSKKCSKHARDAAKIIFKFIKIL